MVDQRALLHEVGKEFCQSPRKASAEQRFSMLAVFHGFVRWSRFRF